MNRKQGDLLIDGEQQFLEETIGFGVLVQGGVVIGIGFVGMRSSRASIDHGMKGWRFRGLR